METSHLHSDQQLFARIAGEDESAFRTIFSTYNAQLFPYVITLVKSEQDAREVMQEVFLKLWIQRATLTHIENPGGWLRTLTANTAFDYLRKQVRYQYILSELSEDSLINPADHTPGKGPLSDFRDLIAQAADLLPARKRTIFRLAKLEGYSRREIAEQLGISENTVRNQLGEAMEFIQTYLQQRRHLLIPAGVLACIFGHG